MVPADAGRRTTRGSSKPETTRDYGHSKNRVPVSLQRNRGGSADRTE